MNLWRPRLIWLLPLFVFALGALAVMSARIERQRILRDMEQTFKAHAESVAQLVRLGAENAADSTAFIYDLAGEDLADIARLFRTGPPTEDRSVLMKRLNLAVWVTAGGPGSSFDGVWGKVPDGDRPALADEVLGAGADDLADGETARKNGLYCIWARSGKGRDIYCKDSASLAGYRKKAGLGPLLKQVANWSVVYAAIQDEGAILAASSPTLELPPVGTDPFLSRILNANTPGLDYRRYAWNGRQLFEGAGVFPLADGTTALLRVGIDSSSLIGMEARTELRQKIMVSVVLLLLALSTIAALAFSRWQSRNEEAQRLAAEREEQNRHWQAIGQMAATVAHEVRTPLSTLKMIGQRLKKEFTVSDRDKPEFEELLALLDSESERVNRVVSEFLELGKPLALSMKRSELAGLMESCVSPLRLRAVREGKTLDLDAIPGGSVWVDPERLHQIVQNLAGNALDAVGEGGRVSISAGLAKGGFKVRITDDGPGLDAETLARVQRPFVTTKSHGTGLGLPLAKRLVEAHGGGMEIRSRVGEGTEIIMFFPDAGPVSKRTGA